MNDHYHYFSCDSIFIDTISINHIIKNNDAIFLFIIHFNIRSLQKNIDDLNNYVTVQNKTPDVIALSQIKLQFDKMYSDVQWL